MVDEVLHRYGRLSPTDFVDVDPTILEGHCQIDPEARISPALSTLWNRYPRGRL